MSALSFKGSKAAKLFESLIWYCFVTSNSLSLLRCIFPHQTFGLLAYYRQSVPNFCNHQTAISITVSSPERAYIEYSRIPSPVYQYVINLAVSLPIRRGTEYL